MIEPPVERENRNALYLLSAICMILLTLAVAVQPLFMRNVLGVSFASAGAANASVLVVTELMDMTLVMFLGFLSDRIGRVPITTIGFLVTAAGSFLAAYSLPLGVALGIGGLAFYYVMRVVMSLGMAAVWPQLSALAGDLTHYDNRPRMMANAAFMMALGGTLVYALLMQIPRHAGVLTVMLMTSVIAVIGAVVARGFLKDVAPRLEKEEIPWRRIFDLIAKQEKMRLSFATAFLARSDMVFIGMFAMMWFIYFADIVGVGQEDAAARGGALIGLAGAVVLLSLPFWGQMIERLGRVQSLTVGLAFSGIGFLMMGLVVNPFDWFIALPTVFIAIGQAGCLVAPQVLAIDQTPKDIRGSVLGAFGMVGGVGIVFFVLIGGLLFDAVGPHAPFVFIGVGNIVLFGYALWVLRGRFGAGETADPGLSEARKF